MSKEELEEIQETFDYFDGDDNGSIDRKEFAKVMDALGADMTEDELDFGFEVIDGDSSGEIDFDEFSEWWLDR